MKTALISILFFFLFASPSTAEQSDVTSRSGMIKETLMQKREALKENKETIKKDRKEKVANYKNRLATFKDKVKAERVDRITTIFQTINTNRTTLMQTNLEKMSVIINKLEEKITQLEKEGKDTTEAKQAIQEAKTAITQTIRTVKAQGEKDYTMTITTESMVKNDAAAMRNILHTDLQTLHKTVVDIRNLVTHAIAETKVLIGNVPNGE